MDLIMRIKIQERVGVLKIVLIIDKGMSSTLGASPDYQDYQTGHLPNGYENEGSRHPLLLS